MSNNENHVIGRLAMPCGLGLVLALAAIAGALPFVQDAWAGTYPTAVRYEAKGARWVSGSSGVSLYAVKTSSLKKAETRAKAKSRVRARSRAGLKRIADAAAGKGAHSASPKFKKTKVNDGLVQVGNRLYYFDRQGIQRSGWQCIAPSYYAFFRRATGKGATMRKSALVEGVRLDRHGFARLNETSLPELDLYVRANELAQKVTKPQWGTARKLRACFNYFASYERWGFRVTRQYESYDTQHVAYALDLLDPEKGEGDCDSWATAFGYVATAIGCKGVLTVTNGVHSWNEIDGLIYDAQRSIKHERMYGVDYGSLVPGTGKYKRYCQTYLPHRVFPARSAWEGTAVPRVALGDKYRIASFDHARYYASKAGYARSAWKRYRGCRYYLKADGRAATGVCRVKDGGKKRWAVFYPNGALAQGAGTMFVPVGDELHLVDKNGWAVSGVYRGRFYLPNGLAGTGVQFSDGRFYALGDDGVIDEARSSSLNAAAVRAKDAGMLLSLLGEPEKVTETTSCLDYFGYEGTDKLYRYRGFTVQTFSCPELGEVYWATF